LGEYQVLKPGTWEKSRESREAARAARVDPVM